VRFFLRLRRHIRRLRGLSFLGASVVSRWRMRLCSIFIGCNGRLCMTLALARGIAGQRLFLGGNKRFG
jgi:hypothetical protein